MRIRVDPQDRDSTDERLRALACMLGRLAAREVSSPLPRLASNSHRSDLRFDAEGVPVDEHHENK